VIGIYYSSALLFGMMIKEKELKIDDEYEFWDAHEVRPEPRGSESDEKDGGGERR
jgi:hypothetical protein